MSGAQSDVFAKRAIDVTFTLGQSQDLTGKPTGQQTFIGSNGANTVKLTGKRVSAQIVKNGGASMGETQLRIFGMTLSQMNQLSTLGKLPDQYSRNQVTIDAGNAGGVMSTVYIGNIVAAWADFQNQPDVAFHVSAFAGSYDAVNPFKPSTFKASFDVASALQNIAGKIGVGFENNGVTAQLPPSYFSGTAWDQIKAIVKHANIEAVLDNNVLAIWPKGSSRGGAVPLISAATGMRGYPSFNPNGIIISSRFNPQIAYGAKVKVQSIVTPACGIWVVTQLSYDLTSETPDGPWFTDMQCVLPSSQAAPQTDGGTSVINLNSQGGHASTTTVTPTNLEDVVPEGDR